MRYWLGIGVACLVLLGAALLCSWPGAERVRATLQSDGDCTHYVDNQASTDGDGTESAPWNNIAGHVDDLAPGDVMCVRGDLAPPGRVYTEPTIVVENNSGTQQAPIAVRTYPGEYVVLHTTGRTILDLVNVDYWHFDGFIFDKQGNAGYAISFNYADHHVISNCEIMNGSHEGIHFSQGSYNLVEDCEIHDFQCGFCMCGASGVSIAGGTGNVFRSNEFYDFSDDAIHFYDLWNPISGTLIENNHFYLTTSAQPGENAVDVKRGSPTIRGNKMHGYRTCPGETIGEAIVIHLQAADVVIESNEIYDSETGIRVIAADSVQIANNVFHHLTNNPEAWGTYGLQLYGGGDVRVINNTFAQLSTHELFYIGDTTTGLGNLSIQNNLFFNTSGNIQAKPSSDLAAIDYNGWFNAAARVEGPHDVVAADPRFVSPDDYRLRGSSLAVDAGDNASAPAQDFDGNPRPYGPITDLGAFEVQEPPPVTDLWVSEAVTTTDSVPLPPRACPSIRRWVSEGVTTTDSVTITLTWTAPGRVGRSSTADHYELRYDDQVVTQESWDQATIVDANIAAGQPGEAQDTTANLPWSGSGHLYFALRVFDVDSLGSEVSNPAFWPFESVHLPLVRATAAS